MIEDGKDLRKEEIMWNCGHLPLHIVDIFLILISQFSFNIGKNEGIKRSG